MSTKEMGERKRREIFAYIKRTLRNGEKLKYDKIANAMKMAKTTAYKHVKILEKEGCVVYNGIRVEKVVEGCKYDK